MFCCVLLKHEEGCHLSSDSVEEVWGSALTRLPLRIPHFTGNLLTPRLFPGYFQSGFSYSLWETNLYQGFREWWLIKTTLRSFMCSNLIGFCLKSLRRGRLCRTMWYKSINKTPYKILSFSCPFWHWSDEEKKFYLVKTNSINSTSPSRSFWGMEHAWL